MPGTKFDVIVVGGGPGGYVAAIRASQLGMDVGLVESDELGGICLNWGCIPTKALLKSSEIFHLLNNLDEFGISANNFSFDIKKIVARSRTVATQLNRGIELLLNKNNVSVFKGIGKLSGPGSILLQTPGSQDQNLKAKHIILATGARARELPGIQADGNVIWTYRHAMLPDTLPKSLLVIGSGAIGIEFASFYKDLGVKVSVVEMQDRILPGEDDDISTFARDTFEKRGMKFFVGCTVKGLTTSKAGVEATIANNEGKTHGLSAERAILAVGVVGNTENIGIETTKIIVLQNHIKVNKWGETDEPGIFAIGDVTGAPWLAHKASHQGVTCVEHIAGLETSPIEPSNIPGCTFSRPQIASVGLTEASAMKLGYEVKIGKFPFLANGKAIAISECEGLVKTIFDSRTGELLGAHMIGPEVTEQIQGYVIAKTGEMTEAELLHTVFPHPTLSESMHESTLDAFERVIHI